MGQAALMLSAALHSELLVHSGHGSLSMHAPGSRWWGQQAAWGARRAGAGGGGRYGSTAGRAGAAWLIKYHA